MGHGDALMAAGTAAALHRQDGRRRLICTEEGKARWNPLWRENPAVVNPKDVHARKRAAILTFGPESLPYRSYPNPAPHTWGFDVTWRAADNRPMLYLNSADTDWVGQTLLKDWPQYLLIEPPATNRKPRNRCMPMDQFQAFAAILVTHSPLPIVQLDHPTTIYIPGVERIAHDGFLQAAVAVAHATLSVLPEGGLAHAAAATNAPATVIWGSWGPMPTLAYPDHLNIHAGGTPCGRMVECDHCAANWRDSVYDPEAMAIQTLQHLSRVMGESQP